MHVTKLVYQLQSFIQGSGIGADRLDDRNQVLHLLAPDGGGELGLSRGHPVAVSEKRVDLAVVRDESEGLGKLPIG